jgi:phospholipid/cholesterol/gamma-HCH transport system substrate-binding protein
MNKRGKPVALMVGSLILAAFVGALYLALTAGSGLPGKNVTAVKAQFTDVGGLRVGDDVREASSRIGQVRSIRLDGNRPVVTLQLDGSRNIYKNARAAVWARSALGQNFVELSRGTSTAGRMARGDVISSKRTVPPAQLDQLLSVLDAPTRKSAAGLIRETGGGVAGHSEDLSVALGHAPELLDDLGTVSSAASSKSADLPAMLRATDTLATRFAGREATVTSLVKQLDSTLEAVAVDHAKPLRTVLAEAPPTLSKTREALVELHQPLADLESGMTTLRPGAHALGESTEDLRGTLGEAVEPLDKVGGVAKQAQPAVADLTDLFADARPLAPRVGEALGSARVPAGVLAPYSPEISRFFTYWSDANRYSDKSGHYLRIGLVLRPESVDGIDGVPDPLVHRNAYPGPGQASRDRMSTILGGR